MVVVVVVVVVVVAVHDHAPAVGDKLTGASVRSCCNSVPPEQQKCTDEKRPCRDHLTSFSAITCLHCRLQWQQRHASTTVIQIVQDKEVDMITCG